MSVQGALALLFFLSIGLPANAQDYPSKPIRVLLPFAGGTDVVARLLSAKMSPAIGQQLVTEPRLGAGATSPMRRSPKRRPTATPC
jgi:tripartite-type tricarboxylate transporter receptor subunit TctC